MSKYTRFTCVEIYQVYDSVVGIATRYELDGPGIESKWVRNFLHPSRPAPGAHPAYYTTGIGSICRG